MNPNETNPLMFILEADPGRYIKTPAATVLAFLKALEGAAACFCGVVAGYRLGCSPKNKLVTIGGAVVIIGAIDILTHYFYWA